MLEGALILIEVHLGEKEPRVQEAARFIGRVCCKGAVASQPHALVGRLGFLGFLIVSQNSQCLGAGIKLAHRTSAQYDL
jgi:hypothetical protein